MKKIIRSFDKFKHQNEQSQYYSLNKASLMTNSVHENQKSKGIKKLQAQIQFKGPSQEKHLAFWSRVYFTPESRFIIMLSLINLFLIYLYFVQIPITIAFENHRTEEQSQKIFEYINIPAITIFIFSIFVKLKTGFYREGVLICQQQEVLKNYFMYSFMFDFLSITSVFIYEISEILKTHDGPISYRYIVALFYLKAPQLFKIQKSIISSFDLKRRIKAFIKLFLLLAKIFLVCNITACGFFYLSDTLCPDPDCVECCWINALIVMNTPIKNSPWITQYSFSLYWASTTMISIGYGDITPLNQHEVVYTILIQFVACFVFAFSINEIWSIIQEMKVKKIKIHGRMNIMNVYMRDKNVSENLKSRVNAYLSHFYHTKNLREKELEKQIIDQLTPSLRKQLYFQSYGFIFKEQSFFKQFNSQFLRQVSECIKETGFFEEQLLYDPNQKPYNYDLYYVAKGQLENFIQLGVNPQNYIVLSTISENSMIGINQFVKQINYKSSMMAIRYSLVYKLSFLNWKEYLSYRDEELEKFFRIRHAVLYDSDLRELKIFCPICRSKRHLPQQCIFQNLKEQQQNTINKYQTTADRAYYERHDIKSSLQINSYHSVRKMQPVIRDEFGRKSKKFPLRKMKSMKIISFPDKSHNEKINKMVEKKKLKESIWTQNSDSEAEMVYEVLLNIDKVHNFEYYHLFHNANTDWNKEKKKGISPYKLK